MKFFILVFIGPFCLLGCKKNKSESPQCTTTSYPVPFSLFFELKSNGVRIIADNILDHLKLSYYLNGNKMYVQDFTRAINEGGYNARDSGILVTQAIAYSSSSDNIKDYYLEFPNGDIDTLYVDYRHVTNCAGDTAACHCLYPRYSVKFNNQVAGYDYTVPQTVYLFNK